MKKYYLFAGLVLLAASPAFAQTKIGAAGAPDSSAMLEVTSGAANNKGLLLPRLTTVQRNAITSPATGLMIYNTTTNQAQVNTGTPAAPIWVIATAANSGWDLVGNSGTNPTNNFIGTTDNQPLSIRTNNTEKMRVTAAGYVGVGTTAPIAKLNVVDTGNANIVVGSSTGDMMSFSLGNGHHGMSRNLISSGGGGNDVALYTTSGGSPVSLYLAAKPAISDSIPLDQFVLKSTGNVGIGTNTPAQKLHVQGTARIATAVGTPITITGRNAAGDVGNVTLGSGLALTGGVLNTTTDNADWNLIGNTGTNPATNFIGTGDAQPLVIRTSNVEQLRVTAAGDVGIGTTAPAQSLHVQGTARIATAVGTPNTITGRNAAGDVGNVTLGSGLALTGGVLNTTADNADWNLTGNTGTNPATNFIGTSDAQPLVIRTNNTEQVRVTAAGNVGINNTNPLSPLSFESAAGSKISFYSSGTTNHYGIGVSSSQLNYHVNPGATHAFFAGGTNGDGTELMRIQSNGDIGIGTNAPAQTLHVAGTARISTAVGTPTTITGRNAAGDVGNVTLGAGLALTGGVLNTTADNADWNLTGNTGTNPATNFIGTSDAQPLVIRTSNTEQVRVTAAGDVGIGTTAPAQSLHVQGTARIATATGTPTTITGRNAAGDVGNVTLGSGLALTGGVLNTTADNADWNLTGNTGTNPATNFIGTGDAQPLVIRTSNTEKLRVTAAGNVGIGTASPAFTLDVNGSIKASTDVLPASNFGSAMAWNSVSSGLGATELVNYKGTGGGGFRFYSLAPGVVPAAGVGELMHITGTGNVGIGTATPAAKLDVNGTARISGSVPGNTMTNITGRDATGNIGNITLGTGINLTAGVLSVPPPPVQLLLGTITGGGVNVTASTTGWLYTGATITLPANSTFKVTADMLLNIAPVNTAGTYIVPADQSLWIRSTFADSPTGGPSADLIGSNLISGNISTGMTLNMLHGTVALSNTTNAPKTYYYIVGNVQTYGFTPTVYGFGSGGAGENQIYAMPIN